MASASDAGKSKQSKSDPNRGDGPLATAPSDPNSLPAPLSRYESQKRRDWNTFGQYLRNQRPPITLAGCRGNHVIDFLRYLDQFGKTKVHIPLCPFYGYPDPPAPCPCPLRQAWGSLDALIGRLTSAYEEHGGRPESNPFAGRAVRVYLREVRDHQAKARGIPYKKKARKRPTTVTDKTVVASKGQGGNATGSGGDGSGSAAQTTFTGCEEFMKNLMLEDPSTDLLWKNCSKDNEPAIEIFQNALPEHHNPDTLKKQYDAEKAKRELELQEYLDTKLANEEHEKDLDLTGIPESFSSEEENEKQILLLPQGMVFDTEAVEMTSNSSKQTQSEIEFIEDEASQRWPEGLQVEEMQQEAISTLKPQGVFDVEAVKMPESSGQMKFQIADKEMEPEADRPQEAQQFLMQVGLRLTEPPKDEDWENANEIYLMDNELSVLPENPRCLKLSALFLQRNYKLRLIPPSFFDNMPALQTLNLSRTNIKSLPNSIIRLVSLKRLFLNDCHCFMVLSPKIGELRQLEVLSLEGTEIMDLPLVIKKLTNLTCLEVSFCEFQSNCRQAMQLNAVVPCGVISVLSQLEELSIDVDPGDERWDACVEDIVNEVCTLKRLYSLKFYFQRVELLSHIQRNIPSLLYFRFTVGRHVKRIMSGVPRDVEFELERWDRCLKYINGVDVPRDIKKVLQHATAFFLDRHATVKKLSNFGIQNMEKLKCLVMGECSEVQVIIDEADGYEEDDSDEIVSESYGTEKIVLGSLEYMYVYYMESLRSVWEGPGPLQPESLFCLKSLTLCTCPQLTTIFTPGLLANLCNLEELKVDDCPSIKSIVSHDVTAEHKISYFLPELKKISLHYTPELFSISNGLHIAPKLEWLSFYNCPNLKNPLVGEVSSQCLKKIKGETSWWEALEWSNGRPGYLDEIFVPIDIWDC